MKEMEYKRERTKGVVLSRGIYKEIMYAVISFGSHPCAYLMFPKNHYMNKMEYEKADRYANVHGGFTYSGTYVVKEFGKEPYVWALGWDYAHSGDYTGYFRLEGDKEWTTEEMVRDCCQAIDQLIVQTPVEKSVALNPMLDIISSKVSDKNGRITWKVKSYSPLRDYKCRIRLFGKFKDLPTEKFNECLAGVPMYITKCEYCGTEFVTNSHLCKICSDWCSSCSNREITNRYMRKYMKRNRSKVGYSMPWYAKNRKEVLESRKKDFIKKTNRSETFKCAVCGKEFNYIKDHYHLSSKICRNPACKKSFYNRKK